MRTVGILVAMQEEAQALLSRGAWITVKGAGRLPVWRCRFGSVGVVMVRSGAGLRRAAAAAEALLRRTGPDVLVIAGLSGALAGELEPGDLLMESMDPDLLCLARKCLQAREVRLHSVDRVVPSALEKSELHRSTGAHAVDMESRAAADVATAAAVPWIALRAVSDSVGEDLPLDFSQTLDEHGLPSRPQILAQLIARPSAWPGILRLARNSGRALKALSQAVFRLLEELEARA